MPFRRQSRGMAMRPVNRIKHVIDVQTSAVLDTAVNVVLADTTDTPTLAATSSVETGSKINGIYLKVEAYARTDVNLANMYMMVFKNPGNNLTFPNANVVGSDDNKRYVIHQEMVMMEQKVNGNPRTLFNGVIVIPRGYRRNGPDDQLAVQLFSPGVSWFGCVQCHYKEFR